jgi:hypothetical protein
MDVPFLPVPLVYEESDGDGALACTGYFQFTYNTASNTTNE